MDNGRDDERDEEIERLRDRWAISPEQWEESQERVRAEERRKAKELFGDREPFAIPDEDTDS